MSEQDNHQDPPAPGAAQPPPIAAWLGATRPKTLTAALAPILIGAALAVAEGHRGRLWVPAVALLSALFIQIGTNLINDAQDFRRGADDAKRVGPQRATASGLLSGRTVELAGFLCFGLAILCALPLAMLGGIPLIVLGLVSLICGWAYTAGPMPLAYVGLGEPFVLVFFGPVAVAGTYALMSGEVSAPSVLAGLQIGGLATVLIAINNLRDIEGDRRARKMTPAARFGPRAGKLICLAMLFAPFVGGLAWLSFGRTLAASVPMAALVLAVPLGRELWDTPAVPESGIRFNQALGRAALTHLCFALLLSTGLLLGGT